MVARWQNLIPSFPWIVPGWRVGGSNFAIWQHCTRTLLLFHPSILFASLTFSVNRRETSEAFAVLVGSRWCKFCQGSGELIFAHGCDHRSKKMGVNMKSLRAQRTIKHFDIYTLFIIFVLKGQISSTLISPTSISEPRLKGSNSHFALCLSGCLSSRRRRRHRQCQRYNDLRV